MFYTLFMFYMSLHLLLYLTQALHLHWKTHQGHEGDHLHVGEPVHP